MVGTKQLKTNFFCRIEIVENSLFKWVTYSQLEICWDQKYIFLKFESKVQCKGEKVIFFFWMKIQRLTFFLLDKNSEYARWLEVILGWVRKVKIYFFPFKFSFQIPCVFECLPISWFLSKRQNLNSLAINKILDF